MRSHRPAVSVLLGALVCVATVGCSLVYDFPNECTTDDQCRVRGAGWVCRERFCVAPGDTAPTDAGPDGDAAGDTAELGPETATPPLLFGPCDRLIGDITPEQALQGDTILLGALMPRSGQLAELGPYLDRALELAVDELNQNGGLFGRKFAVLSCDDGTDPVQAVAAAEHLVDVAHVPAIIGAVSSGVTIEVFNRVAHPRGVLMLSPVASAPIITTIPDAGLLWRVAPSAAIQGRAMAHHLLTLAIERLAVVHRNDTWGNGIREALQEVYCAERPCGGDDYLSANYADATISADQSAALVDIAAFDPDATVLISYINDGALFLNLAAETDLRDFLLVDGARDAVFLTLVSDAEILCRVFGTNFQAPGGALFDAFAIRYRANFQVDVVPYVPNAYDALYLLAYAYAHATAAVGEAPVTGAALATGMRQLSAGRTIAAGPANWYLGVQTLQSGASIDYAGVSGDVDFAEDTDEIGSAVEGWRFNLTRGEPETLGLIYSLDGVYQAPAAPSAADDEQCAAYLTVP